MADPLTAPVTKEERRLERRARLTLVELRAHLDRPPPRKNLAVGDLYVSEPCTRCEDRGHIVAPATDYGFRMVPCPKCNR